MSADASDSLYRITYHQAGEIVELYARSVGQDPGMPGFLEIGDLVFDARSGVVVDPAEERLEREFAGVDRFWVPIFAVVRIDRVDQRGRAKISSTDERPIHPFPVPFKPS